MPLYEYRCHDCGGLSTILVYSWSSESDRACRHCDGANLDKLVSGFTMRRSWGDSLNWAPSGETLGDVNEDDPHSINRHMGRIKSEMGGQVTQDFNDMRKEWTTPPSSNGHSHGPGHDHPHSH